MREYRVSDITIDVNQPAATKAALQKKLNALTAEGWTVDDVLQAGDVWFIKSSREQR